MTEHSPSDELTEEQRRQAFREELARTSPQGRSLTPSAVPAKAVWLVIGAFAVLGLGGSILEHFAGNLGGAPGVTTPSAPHASTTAPAPSRSALDLAYVGLQPIGEASAPALGLLDQHGAPWDTSTGKGRVVLVAFFDQDCLDICPVVGTELREALAMLAAQGVPTDVVIVNTDPRTTAVRSDPAALRVPRLAGDSRVHFLTGPLSQLNRVWREYGVTVKVGALAGEVAHNDVIYFVSPRGQLSALARPFARRVNSSRYTLSPGEMRRFARGLAIEASSLAR